MRTRLAGLLSLLVLARGAAADLPVTASVQAVRSFPLGDVRLLDSPFKRAMDLNAAYLLSLDPDRLLHNAREYAGLTPKAETYGGWEQLGLAGHTLGHYLTALSQQYAATGDLRFKKRVDYIVSELALCQEGYGDGYVGALQPLELQTLRDIGNGVVNLKGPHNFEGGAWVPWYTEHKVLNGLKDAWVLTGNTQARDVALRLADWAGTITAGLTPEQDQTMLEVEHGGMMDVLVELYSLTGNKAYLETSRRFYHKKLMDPLAEGHDDLIGKHANTQIPKMIGEARTYEVTGDPKARAVAANFWEIVADHHSYVIGGNSENEHFFPEDQTSRHLDLDAAETCNTYNMLKLTEHVFEWDPRTHYADFYERALYNHILASQDPKLGMYTYYMSLKPGLFRTYSSPHDSFWCCVGTGMENHTKYGEAIYFHGRDDLYVNLFIPSELTWAEKGLVLGQATDYPKSGTTVLTVKSDPKGKVTLRVRCPGWASGPVRFSVNGSPVAVDGRPGTYAAISGEWKRGDTITADIPMVVRSESTPDDASKVAFLYGPVVLAGDLGPAPTTATSPYSEKPYGNAYEPAAAVPTLVRGSAPVESLIVRAADGSLSFHTEGLGRPNDVTLRPFWELSFERYNIYWDVDTEEQWKFRTAAAKSGS
jgi:DUF1680 family protein